MYQGLVVHHIPGRMRVKLPFLKGYESSAEQIKELISPITGINQIDFNPITGSAVITYDAARYETFPKQLAEYAAAFGLVITATSSTTNNNHHHVTNGSKNGSEDLPQATQVLINSFKRLNAEVSAASGNGVDMKALLPISLAVYALLKIGSELTTPLWVTLGLFSFSSFVSLHPGALDGSAAGNHARKRRPNGTTRRPNKSS